MSMYDEAVDRYIIDKFINNEGRYQHYEDSERRYVPSFDGGIDDIKVATADFGWECGCYSEYTRDDSFEMKAVIMTKTRSVLFAYAMWSDIPQAIQELDAFIINDACFYESDDYDY